MPFKKSNKLSNKSNKSNKKNKTYKKKNKNMNKMKLNNMNKQIKINNWIDWTNFDWNDNYNINNIKYQIKNKGKTFYGKFWMENCPHCVAIVGVWKDVVDTMRNKNVQYYDIDIEQTNVNKGKEFIKEVSSTQGEIPVNGYPTIYKIKNGEIQTFDGNRTKEEIINWLEK